MFVKKEFTLKVFIEFLALLYFTQLPHINAELEFVRKLHTFPEKEVVFTDFSVYKENIVFGVCENQNENKVCRIVHQKYPYYENTTASCNFTFKIASERFKYDTEYMYMNSRPLGKDQALLVWKAQNENTNETYVKLTTLNMSDCNMFELQFLDLKNQNLYGDLFCFNRVVRYNDNNFYDLFLEMKNPYGNAIRKLRVDTQTGLVEELDSRMKNVEKLFRVTPLDDRFPAKGYVYTEANENRTDIFDWLIKSDGSQKLLQRHNIMLEDSPGASAGNNMIGICSFPYNDSNIQCTQYDENGIVQSRTLIHDSKSTRIKSVHMSPQGGFLLLLAKMKNRLYFDYRVIRVDSKGQVVGVIRLENFDNFPNDLWAIILRIYDKDDGKYCITHPRRAFKQGSEIRRDVIDIAAYCFTDDDFTNGSYKH